MGIPEFEARKRIDDGTKEDLEKFVTQVTRPEDFGEFWQGVMAEAAQVPLEPRISLEPIRSNQQVQVSQSTYRSLEGLRYPPGTACPLRGEGPFPAIIIFPGYKSEPRLHREWAGKESSP